MIDARRPLQCDPQQFAHDGCRDILLEGAVEGCPVERTLGIEDVASEDANVLHHGQGRVESGQIQRRILSQDDASMALVRTFAVVAVLLIAFAASLCAISTQALDRSPILGTPLAEASRQAIRDALPTTERGSLRAGWAARSMTPPIGTPTLGYGARWGEGTRAVSDSVFVRALAIAAGDGAPIVILSAELCLWTTDLSEAVASAVSDVVLRERLYVGATHTHNGPGGFVHGPAIELSMGAFDPDQRELILRASEHAVRDAVAKLAPAKYRARSLDGSTWIENRSRPEALLDDRIELVEFEREDGARFALVVFAAHATSIGPAWVETSGDYPGALVRGLESQGFDGALFLAGGTGQAGPRLDGDTAQQAGTEAAYSVGEQLADAIGQEPAEPRAFRDVVSLAVLRAPVALPPWRARIAGRAFRPWLARWLLGMDQPVAHIHALRLDETVFLGHSFEMSAVVARDLEGRAADRGLQLSITSFNGGHAFYVVPGEDFDLPVYESGMTFFGPGLADYLAQLSEDALAAITLSESAREPPPRGRGSSADTRGGERP